MTLRELVAMIEKNCADSGDTREDLLDREISFDVDGVVFDVEAVDMYISAESGAEDYINITLN